METVVALHRNHLGEIINFVTSTGRVISYRKALIEAASGQIHGLATAVDGYGNVYLNTTEGHSFDHLPDMF